MNDSVPSEAVELNSDDKEDSNEPLEVEESLEDQLTDPPPNINKSMRSMSRSTFDSIIDEFIEDDWEKRSAFGVSLAVVLIWTIFLTLLGVALSVSLGVQHASQSKKLAFTLCSKVREAECSEHFKAIDKMRQDFSPQFPDWSYLGNNSSAGYSWCDDRKFNLAFTLSGVNHMFNNVFNLLIKYLNKTIDHLEQCPCFDPQLKPDIVEPLWPYTGIYGHSLSKH